MHVILDTPGGVGLYLSYNIIAWLITSILIGLGLWQITLNKKIYYSKMLLWLSLGCTFLIIPVFYHFEFTDHAIPRVLALIGGLLFLFSLYQFQLSKLEALRLLVLILLAIVIEGTFGLVQFFLFEEGDWGGYIVGSSRPHGVFLQPNVMASFMATGLAIALFLSIQKKLFKNTLAVKCLIYLGLFSTSFLLILLQSRTGFIAAATVVILLSPLIYRKNKKKLAVNFAIITLAILSSIICLNNSNTPIRDEDSNKRNISVRLIFYTVSIDMIKEKPLLGFGYGGFERSFIDHFNTYAIENPDIGDTITNLSHPHNEVLFWVVEGGLMALFAFALFTIGYICTWVRIPLQTGLVVFALIFPLLLHSQLEFPFYSSVSHWLVFLIMLWLVDRFALSDDESNRSIAISKTFLFRFIALLIPLIFIPFMLTALHTAHILVEHEKNPTSQQALESLSDIINPIAWQSRLDAAVYAHILIDGIRNKDIDKLKSYLIWAIKRLKHQPRPSLYRNSLLILKALNQEQGYQLLLQEAKRTYPQEDDWHNSILSQDKSVK